MMGNAMLALMLTGMLAAPPEKPCEAVVAELGMPELSGLPAMLAAKYLPDAVSIDDVKKKPEKYVVRAAILNAADALRSSYKVKTQMEIHERRVEPEKTNITELQKGIAAAILKLREATEDLEKAAAKRKTEPSARWQANLDFLLAETKFRTGTLEELNLAYGTVHRNELPALKSGNNGWKLDPAETMRSKGDIRRLVEDAQADFETLKKTYADTPWAKLADRELAAKPGLNWIGATVRLPPMNPMRKKP